MNGLENESSLLIYKIYVFGYITKGKPGIVVHVYNPSYLWGRDRRCVGVQPRQR
jgi:hypothetical protein